MTNPQCFLSLLCFKVGFFPQTCFRVFSTSRGTLSSLSTVTFNLQNLLGHSVGNLFESCQIAIIPSFSPWLQNDHLIGLFALFLQICYIISMGMFCSGLFYLPFWFFLFYKYHYDHHSHPSTQYKYPLVLMSYPHHIQMDPKPIQNTQKSIPVKVLISLG